MSTGSYWESLVQTRRSRRRALTAMGGTAMGAVLLAACGGGSDGEQRKSDKSGLVETPVDTSGVAKTGGTIKHWADGDAVHFDAVASNANGVVNWVSAFAYPRVLRFQTPKYPKQGEGIVEGELGETYELSSDKLTLTFKLRQGMKWDSRAPTNNRPIDAEDVTFSWKKFVQLNPSGLNLANEKSPSAPIDSIAAPDSRTIVFKMKQPDSSIVQLFASWDHFYVMPRESTGGTGGFDARTTVRGHGPWMLEEHVPSVRFVWKKNPDYFLKDRPFADRLERPIIPEYAARLAQFKTGNIYTTVATANDVVQTKADAPKTVMRQEPNFTTSPTGYQAFGYEGDSPFKDVRVRQAVSMLVDREAYVDVIENRDNFRGAGIDMPTAYHTVLPPGYGDFWLDPKDGKKFGENAKYLNHNVAEAKKLLAAAGFPNGFSFDMFYSTSLYAQPYQRIGELVNGMLLDGGLKGSQRGFIYEQFKDIYYEAYYGPSVASGKTKGITGMVHLADPAVPTVPSFLFNYLHKNGGRYHGMSPDGRNAVQGDPKINEMIDRLRGEFDRAKQVEQTHDLIRYFTGQSYYVPRAATVKPMTLTWPALGNMGVFQASPGENQWAERNLHWWIDPTKAPLAQA
jgi:peptide/nickel transport system substrate-binding protein